MQTKEFDPYISYLASHLTPARLQHSLGVMRVMQELASIYGLDSITAQTAGLLHDAGKELTQGQMIEIARAIHFPLIIPSDRDPLFLHGPASAYVAAHDLGIDDPLILEAIFRHSFIGTGQVQSPVFCWCLRFADFLEPGRDWDEAHDRLQPLIYSGNMAEAALGLMDWLIPFLQSMQLAPHPGQFVLRQKLLQYLEDGTNEVRFDQIPV